MSDAPKPDAAEGTVYDTDTPERRRQVLAQAVDYRGDVTLELADGEQVVGYVFDRREKPDGVTVRLLLPEGARRELPAERITRVAFTGRDTAAGKSWETWVKKYASKKQRGEAANLEPDPL
ncbi:MAG: hypothetical protein WD009_09855 [Phycisphaeraceae bacterium]